MIIDFKTIESEIISFFKRKKFNKRTIGNTNCFVNNKQKNRIFKIAIDEFDHSSEMETFIKEYDEFSKGKLEVVSILITYKKDVDDNVITISSINEANEKLKPYFVDFNLKDNQDITKEDISEEELFSENPNQLIAEMKNPSLSKNKELQKIAKSMQNPHIIARIVAFILVICPLIICFLSMYLSSYKHEDILKSSPETANFFFGAVDFKMTIYLQQYWRILTYGLIPDFASIFNGLLELIICGIVLFGVLKYCFSLIGVTKFAIVIIVSYLIVGFFSSLYVQDGSFSGQTVPLAIATGSLCLTIWTNTTNSVVKLFTKNRIFIPIVVLIALPIIENNFLAKMPIILLAFCISATVLYLLNYDWKSKNKDISLVLAILILGGSILTPFILAFCYTPVPGQDQDILNAIQLMYKYSLSSKSTSEKWIYDLFKVYVDL